MRGLQEFLYRRRRLHPRRPARLLASLAQGGKARPTPSSHLRNRAAAARAAIRACQRRRGRLERGRLAAPPVVVRPRRGVQTVTGLRLRAGFLRYPLGSQAIQGGQVLLLHGLGERRRDGRRRGERRDDFALAACPRPCPRAATIVPRRPRRRRPRARRLRPHRPHRRRPSSGGSGRSLARAARRLRPHRAPSLQGPHMWKKVPRLRGRFLRCACVCARGMRVSDAPNSPLHEGMRSVA